MMGRSLSRLIASTTRRSNAPPLVLTPIRIVGFSASMVSHEVAWRALLVRVDLLRGREVVARGLEQPVDVEHGDARLRGLLRQPLALHGRDEHVGDADGGRARAQEEDALVAQRRARGSRARWSAPPARRSPCPGCRRCSRGSGPGSAPGSGWRRCPSSPRSGCSSPGRPPAPRRTNSSTNASSSSCGGGACAQPEVERVGAQRGVGRADVEQHREQARPAAPPRTPCRAAACRWGCPCRWPRCRRARGCARRSRRR